MRKRLIMVTMVAMLVFLSSCGLSTRGRYVESTSGYIIKDGIIIDYHTNDLGFIDYFVIDQSLSYFEALEYISFDENLSEGSYMSVSEKNTCNISYESVVPKYIQVNEEMYFMNVRDSGYCSFDQFELVDNQIEKSNTTLFQTIDFKSDPFSMTLYVLDLEELSTETYNLSVVSPLPVSFRQSGEWIEDHEVLLSEFDVLSQYVLNNQSINLLILRDDFKDENVSAIWSDETIERLGRDSDIIKVVKDKNTDVVLGVIEDAFDRLGLFS
jgi:hypothetical protein